MLSSRFAPTFSLCVCVCVPIHNSFFSFRICSSIEHLPNLTHEFFFHSYSSHSLGHSLSSPCIHNIRFSAQSPSLSRCFIFISSWNKRAFVRNDKCNRFFFRVYFLHRARIHSLAHSCLVCEEHSNA